MSLPLLSSEHPTTQPSHHFILLTYITVITALADLLCADLEILSLVLPPTHFWFFSDNRTLVSFPDLPPSFSLFLTPSMWVRKLFPNLLSPSSKDYNSSAVGLVRYSACGQTFFGLGLQRARVLTFRSLLWSLADTGSPIHSVHLLPARAHLYISGADHSLGMKYVGRLPSCACMETTAHSSLPEEHTTVFRLCVTNCLETERQVLPRVSTLLQSLRGHRKAGV